MRIEWVNHASFILQTDDARIICDPWLEGPAFHNGWALLSKTVLPYEDFSKIDYIWFSHEHPDHFSPPNLKKIPAEYRAKITILYQMTNDHKVCEFCKKLGFKDVREIPSNSWQQLTAKTQIFLCPWKTKDSWVAFRSPDCTVLNLNDCVTENDTEIWRMKQAMDNKIDLLLTQFSYAQWEGRRSDPQMRRKAAHDKLDEVAKRVKMLEPKNMIPFASFVWFCHEENYYQNDEINKIGDVYNFLKNSYASVNFTVLYPGDSWQVGTQHDNPSSIHRYNQDYQRIANKPELFQSKKIDWVELEKSAEDFQRRARQHIPLPLRLLVPKLRVFIEDLPQSAQFSLTGGLQKTALSIDKHDITVSAEALQYCFQFDWGFNTLYINGRFDAPMGGHFRNFVIYEKIAGLMNHDLSWRDIFQRGILKVFPFLAK